MKEHGDNIMAKAGIKSKLNQWKVLAIVAVIAMVVVSIESSVSGGKSTAIGTTAIKGDYIARISIIDVVFDNKELRDHLKKIEKDDSAKALIVWINSPGGSAVAGEEVYYQLRKIAKKKPVVAVMRSIAASAGYMIAIGADHIVAREGTITGSIGVLIQAAEISELAKKIGITPITVKSSPLKGSPSLLEKADDRAIESLQTMIDSFYHSFVKLVASRRPFSLEKAYSLADGRVFSGPQALELEMIDEIGGEDEALNWLKNKKKIDISLNIVDVDAKPKGLKLLEDIANSTSRKFWSWTRSSLDGLNLIWHPAL